MADAALCGASSIVLFLIIFKLLISTMAEAAGLVLGAIPLVFLALDTYRECLEFGRSYANYADTLMTIRDEVYVQQMLFHETMGTMGLEKPTYLELDECLQERFPEKRATFLRFIAKMTAIIDQYEEQGQ
jgi:hypothetical protein